MYDLGPSDVLAAALFAATAALFVIRLATV